MMTMTEKKSLVDEIRAAARVNSKYGFGEVSRKLMSIADLDERAADQFQKEYDAVSGYDFHDALRLIVSRRIECHPVWELVEVFRVWKDSEARIARQLEDRVTTLASLFRAFVVAGEDLLSPCLEFNSEYLLADITKSMNHLKSEIADAQGNDLEELFKQLCDDCPKMKVLVLRLLRGELNYIC